MHIVDSDEEDEEHNLNRRVLYNEQHIGQSKADVGQKRLNQINSNIQVHGYNLLPCHVSQDTWDEEEDFAVDDLDDAMD